MHKHAHTNVFPDAGALYYVEQGQTVSCLAVKEFNGCLRRPRTVSKTKSIKFCESGRWGQKVHSREVQYPMNLIKVFQYFHSAMDTPGNPKSITQQRY